MSRRITKADVAMFRPVRKGEIRSILARHREWDKQAGLTPPKPEPVQTRTTQESLLTQTPAFIDDRDQMPFDW